MTNTSSSASASQDDFLLTINSLRSLSLSDVDCPLITADSLPERQASQLIRELQRLTNTYPRKDPIYRETLEELLEANAFHYRLARRNELTNRYEQTTFITAVSEASDLLVCRQSRNNYRCYSLRSESYITIARSDLRLTGPVYEILPLFPEKLDSFWALIRFTLPAINTDLIYALVLSLVLTLISLTTPILTSRVIGDVIPSGDLNLILSTFVFSVILSMYSAVISWLQSYYLLRINQKLSLRIQIPIFHRILSLPVEFLDRYTTGDLSSRATSIGQVLSALSSTTLSSVIGCISIFGYLGLMLYYDFALSIPSLIYILVVAIAQVILARRQMSFESKFIDELAASYDNMIEILKNITRVRTSGSEMSALSRISRMLFRSTSISYNVNTLSATSQSIAKILATLGTSLIYSVIIYRLVTSNSLATAMITTTKFIVFMSAFQSFSSSFLGITSLFNTLLGKTSVQIKRALPLILQPTEQSLCRASLRQVLTGEIEFKNVSFHYPGSDKLILDDLSFKITPHKFNVLFGPSGCGKSTIASLILGFYRPTTGSIFIDGTELSELDLRFYRSQIGTVLQSPQLTTSSIREAVTAGLRVSDSEIWQALEKVNLLAEIEALPMRLETILCEGSTNISGGQRQRLCIARALLRNPSMMLEDESTSALDNISQSVITQNLAELSITRVVIAHRLSAIRNCDNLIVVSNGKLETIGSFDYCSTASPYLSSVLNNHQS